MYKDINFFCNFTPSLYGILIHTIIDVLCPFKFRDYLGNFVLRKDDKGMTLFDLLCKFWSRVEIL